MRRFGLVRLVTRLGLAGLAGGALLVLSGCASQGYGSGGGFEEYDDCYDGYCNAYNAYGRIYERPQQPVIAARSPIDRVDRAHGTPTTVSRDTGIHAASVSPAFGRGSVSPPPPPPPPTTVSRN